MRFQFAYNALRVNVPEETNFQKTSPARRAQTKASNQNHPETENPDIPTKTYLFFYFRL